MAQVNLSGMRCFQDGSALQTLNRLVVTHSTLTPQQVAQSTGCDLNSAMAVLVLLYDRGLADGFLEVYHQRHPDGPPIRRIRIEEGPPPVPFECEVCEGQVSSVGELYFDLLFRPISDVQFMVTQHDPHDD